MERRFWINIPATEISAACDILEIRPGSFRVRPLAVLLGRSSVIGDGDVTDLSLSWIRGHATAGSGGTRARPITSMPEDPGAKFSAYYLNTTIASGGSPVFGPCHHWNVQWGFERPYTESEEFIARDLDTTLVLRLNTTPDTITIFGSVLVEEITR